MYTTCNVRVDVRNSSSEDFWRKSEGAFSEDAFSATGRICGDRASRTTRLSMDLPIQTQPRILACCKLFASAADIRFSNQSAARHLSSVRVQRSASGVMSWEVLGSRHSGSISKMLFDACFFKVRRVCNKALESNKLHYSD